MPFFAEQLVPKQKLREGDRAHFECRVVPPNVGKVEWFHEGKPLAMGHRYRTIYDFGYISLDILHVYPEDAGKYICRATNELGSCETRCQVSVQARQTIIHETQCPGGMERLQYDALGLEHQNYNYQTNRSDGFTDDDATLNKEGQRRFSGQQGLPLVAPMVTMPLAGTQKVIEGESAHLECRIEPVNDARIKFEYLHNGKLLVAGSRYHIMSDFGYISLDIDHATPEDSGIYTIRAHNPAIDNSTTTKCETSLKIYVKPVSGVQTQTLHMEALIKLQRLEMGSAANDGNNDDYFDQCTYDTFQRPLFTKPITPESVFAQERDNVEFRCHLIPVADVNLRIEWFHNNRPIQASSRLLMEHEFGVVTLRINRLDGDDSGIYQCRARNQLGEAISTARLRVQAEEMVQTESLNPDGLEQIRILEQPKETQPAEEVINEEPAKFLTKLSNLDLVERHEGESLHLYCQVAPSDDAQLKVDWYFNGRHLVTGSRVHTLEDFGYVYLDIDYLYGRDSGEYLCRVSNKYGTDETMIKLKVTSDKSIVMESQLANPISADRLRQLECPDAAEEICEVKADEPAKFITHIVSPKGNCLEEGANVHFECQVTPKDDSNLQVEWYHNNEPMINGHRHRHKFDFGLVTLDILHVQPEDSGQYRCIVTNKAGQDITQAEFKVRGQSRLVQESQLPEDMRAGYERLYRMEAAWSETKQQDNDDVDTPRQKIVPEFVLKPKPVVAHENSCARFCCRIAAHPPARLIWLVNGEAAVTSSRFKVYYDGMYHLEIPRCKLTDAGQIQVHAKSSIGDCLCSTELIVKPKMDDYRKMLKSSPKAWYDEQSLKAYQQERAQYPPREIKSVPMLTPAPIALGSASRHDEPSAKLRSPGAGTPIVGPSKTNDMGQLQAVVKETKPPESNSPSHKQLIVKANERPKKLDPSATETTGTLSQEVVSAKADSKNEADSAPVVLKASVVKDKSFGMAPAPSTIKRALFIKDRVLSLTPPPEAPAGSASSSCPNKTTSKKTGKKKTSKTGKKC